MRFLAISIILFCIITHTLAQKNDSAINRIQIFHSQCGVGTLTDISMDNASFHQIMISGSAAYNSSYIDIAFANKIVSSQFITEGDKLRQLQRRGGSYLDAGFNYGALYSWKRDSSLFTHQISISDRSLNLAAVSKGLFQFLMFGNANVSQLDIGHCELFSISQKELKYTLHYKPTKNIVVYGTIGIIQGDNYRHGILNDAMLTNYEYGEKLDLSYSLDYVSSNYSKSLLAPSYIGFSLDAGAIYSSNPSHYMLWAGFNDLSSINTLSRSDIYRGRKNISFEGIEINNLFAITDTTFNHIDRDSLFRYIGLEKYSANIMDALPMSIHVGYKLNFAKTFLLQTQLTYQSYHNNTVLLQAYIGKQIKNVQFYFNGRVGGMSNPHFGASIYYDLTHASKEYLFMLSSTALDGFLTPDKSTAVNISLSLAYRF